MFAVQADGQEDPHRRGPRQGRHAASAAAGLHGAPRPAMRLLHAGLPDAGGRRAGARARTSATRSCSTCCRPISAAAPATRTSSRRCAPRPKEMRGNDARRPSSSAARSRASRTGRCSPARAALPPTSRFPASCTCAWCARRSRMARLASIDTAAALALPGVHAVWTARRRRATSRRSTSA